MAGSKLLLDYVYEHETALSGQVFLTQPVGGGQVKDYTWAQTMDQARRMATHIKSLSLEPGARIAILSKNSKVPTALMPLSLSCFDMRYSRFCLIAIQLGGLLLFNESTISLTFLIM